MYDNNIKDIIEAKEGSENAMSKLVENNSGLIWSIVRRFRDRGYELEDLYQIGSLGFIKSIKRFDINFEVQLSTYAVPYILGEIKRFIRDDGIIKVSRNVKSLARKLHFDKEELTKNIKVLLAKVIRIYQINLSGIYQVVIYENKYYGYVLEILKIKEFEYSDFIDLKLEIKFNQPFYLAVDNYIYLEGINNVFYKNNRFFVNLKDVNDVNKIIEYGDVVYKEEGLLTYKSVKINWKNVNWLIWTDGV